MPGTKKNTVTVSEGRVQPLEDMVRVLHRCHVPTEKREVTHAVPVTSGKLRGLRPGSRLGAAQGVPQEGPEGVGAPGGHVYSS